ncbi:hypothetical protein BH20ACT6_BH20ACT6_15770 [soil metagenome]
MLPSSQRLRLRRDFGLATRCGHRAASGTVVVHLARVTDELAGGRQDVHVDDPARVGFVVSRACGPAVTRNRVRRRLRHLMLPRLPELPLGIVLVVRALPAAASASTERLDADLTRCLTRCLSRLVPATVAVHS